MTNKSCHIPPFGLALFSQSCSFWKKKEQGREFVTQNSNLTSQICQKQTQNTLPLGNDEIINIFPQKLPTKIRFRSTFQMEKKTPFAWEREYPVFLLDIFVWWIFARVSTTVISVQRERERERKRAGATFLPPQGVALERKRALGLLGRRRRRTRGSLFRVFPPQRNERLAGLQADYSTHGRGKKIGENFYY